jgi:hypothetical protein
MLGLPNKGIQDIASPATLPLTGGTLRSCLTSILQAYPVFQVYALMDAALGVALYCIFYSITSFSSYV